MIWGTAAGIYDFRRLQIGRCGGLHGRALLTPDCCRWHSRADSIKSLVYVFLRQLQLPHGNTTSVFFPVFPHFEAPMVDNKRSSRGFCAFRGTQGRRQAQFEAFLRLSKYPRFFTDNEFYSFPNEGPGKTRNVAQEYEIVVRPHLESRGGRQKCHSTIENVSRPVPFSGEIPTDYFLFRATNASAEALNTNIKVFRAQLRGIIDLKFFLFRLTRIFA